ncbi:unnamed protein product [Ophioblennius macclurei]
MESQPPPKPWERRIAGTMAAPVNYRSADFAPTVGPATSSGPPVLTRMVPPVPPRPVQPSYRPSYSSFPSTYSPSTYSPYGSSIYGGYGGYGAYSPYSFGGGGGYGVGRYNRLSHGEDVAPSRFVQQAEESSRGAFESIESIVHTFASVSMMLDATFSAVYNSFRAVLDVANQFTRLRSHLAHVLSTFALVRMLRYLYRRLQRLLGRGSEIEDLWADSSQDAVMSSVGAHGAGARDPGVKSWPIFLFFTVVLGGPYLIWRLLSSSQVVEENNTEWASGEDDHVVARAEYDFTAASEEEISLRAGDMLNLAPKEQQPRMRGWLLASSNGQITGLVPANYVKVLGKRRGRKHAEAEMLAREHRANAEPPLQPHSASAPPAFTPNFTLASTDELLESTYRETSESASVATSSSSTVLNIPDKTDL